MIIAVTGHRPDKLGGYPNPAKAMLETFACCAIDPLRLQHQPFSVFTGMAQGWDQAIAKACIVLRVPFMAVIPCAGQDVKWPSAARAEYRAILSCAVSVMEISKIYTSRCMQQRNEWMVDHADAIVALFNGSPGGTANCIDYAAKVGKPVYNCWDHWNKFDGIVRQ